MTILFWLCIALILWVYAGYPALLFLITRFFHIQSQGHAAHEPMVTLIISAYNEAGIIRQKLENSLALDYPRERLEIIVVSDCSDDATDSIVSEYADKGVRLIRMSERGGKTVGLNFAVPQARGEIVIFSDANALYQRMVVRNLVRNFADPKVGCVTGESRYEVDESMPDSTASENLYWRYELALKGWESAIGSLVGGDGAIYGIRKSLFRPMQPEDLSDFVNPMQIVTQGYRNVYEPEAVSFERGAESFEKEFHRKVRIVNRAWRGLWRVRQVLNPLRFGFFTLQVISHKLLRWLVPLFMAGAFLANLLLLNHGRFYQVMLVLQTLFYTLATIGWLQSHRPSLSRLFYVPYYFCMVNYASLLGIVSNYRGQKFAVWNTVREGGR
ncbi:MAG: glycosyltransferase family 2 protein [candidate division KSB1 bacterium]|nr:glycosyltransferase family 2 protein [candidate division KSB1 bacterium]MDZ7302292.1 glycosyltransferase family 2 protein [candidate division KSB1 bacterium]MDZ7311398.1 glycosyltransferase family 2 protein [candidate division KSB1 bacterium]